MVLVSTQPKSPLYANYTNVAMVMVAKPRNTDITAKPRNAGITAKPQFGNFPLWLGW